MKDLENKREYHRKYYQKKQKNDPIYLEKKRKYAQQYYFSHKDENKEEQKKAHRDYQRQWRKDNIEKNKVTQKKHYDNHKEKYRLRAIELTRTLREKALIGYGRKCVCCGEDNIGFLTFDHINNDGKKHRDNLKKNLIYRWIIKNNFPKDIQILCFNCNCGRQSHGGKEKICPHKL